MRNTVPWTFEVEDAEERLDERETEDFTITS